MINKNIIHDNLLVGNSRYSANFDLLMHDYCLKKFDNLLRGQIILEMGCYHGSMTAKLAKIGKQVIALDNDSDCLLVAAKNCSEFDNINYVKSSFEDYSGYKNVNVIYFSHALEHVEFDSLLVSKMHASLNPDVKIIVIVPNACSLSRQIAVNMGLLTSVYDVTSYEKSIGHHKTYDIDMISALFTENKFKIIESGGIMPKIFSNYQFDKALEGGIIDDVYLDALSQLSSKYPEICSSIYLVCTKEIL